MDTARYTEDLPFMDEQAIQSTTLALLKRLERSASIRLISNLTRVSRPALMRWLDSGSEAIDWKTGAWFIMCCEHDFRLADLLDKATARPKHSKVEGRRATNANYKGEE